nr:PREDICTED: UDP-glucuronosyltransferase 2C1-like [Bemisia tabaci]
MQWKRSRYNCKVLLFLTVLRGADCFKALFLFPFPGKSHFGALSVLAEELARKGHDVTVLTHFPNKEASYKEIVLDTKPFDDFMKQDVNVTEMGTLNPLMMRAILFPIFNTVAELLYASEPFRELIASKERYDVVLGEVTFFMPCILAFGHKFSAPVIDLSAASVMISIASNMGAPFSFSYIPDGMLPLSDSMSFMERLENTVVGLWELAGYHWYFLPAQEKMLRKHFVYPGSENMPPLREMAKNVSLLLLNSHFSIGYPRPYPPNMIDVAGMHLKPIKKLPKNLQDFMDGAKNGVIYVSFGTVIKEDMLGEARLLAIVDALSRLKQRVIIKWKDPEPFKDAKNVLTLPFAPQQEILAHPNLVLFVTHGGYNSLIEAAQAGVPVLGIPVVADQFRNIRLYETYGMGIGFLLSELSGDHLYKSILHMINTPSYKENAKKVSWRTRDRPLSPLDTAVYWVEYVVRHNGAPHLRPASVKLSFYQYLLLDVIAFIALVLFLIYKLIRIVCCSKSRSHSTIKHTAKKTN